MSASPYSSPYPTSSHRYSGSNNNYNTANDGESSYILNALDASPIHNRQGSNYNHNSARENSMPLPIDDPMEDPASPYRHNNNGGEDDDEGPSMSREELEAQIRALVMSPSGTSLMDVLVRNREEEEEGDDVSMYPSSYQRNNNHGHPLPSGTPTRDYFGVTDRMYGGGKGQVTIQDQVTEGENEVVLIDLPPSLSVLYAAGFASQNKSSVVNLLAMLSGIAYIREQDNYKEISAQHRKENDACYRLHIKSKESADRLAEMRDKLAKDRINEEMSECTFSPNPDIWKQDNKRIKALRQALNQKGGKKQQHQKQEGLSTATGVAAAASGEGEEEKENGGGDDEDNKAAEAAMEGKAADDEEEEQQEERKKRTNQEFISSVYEWAKGREKKHAANVEKYKNEFQDSVTETRVPVSKKTEYLAKKYRQKQAEEKNAVALLSKLDSNKRAAFAAVASSMKRKSNHHSKNDGDEDDNGDYVEDENDSVNAATKVRSLLELGEQQSPTSHRHAVTCRRSVLDEVTDSHYYPSFEPVTNSMSRREDMFMKYLQFEAAAIGEEGDNSSSNNEDSSSDEEEEEEGEEQAVDGNNEAVAKKKKTVKRSDGNYDEEGGGSKKKKSEFFYDPAVIEETLWAGKADTAKTVKRLVDDVEQRKVRHAQRLEDDKLRQRELMYDTQTGQPLFQPNSMPTVLINKKRVPIDELPRSDRVEAMKILRQKHLDFLHETATRKKENATSRDLAGFFQHCSELQNKAQKRVEKIRKLEEKELTGLFVPKIDEQSAKILAGRGRERVHTRELPVKEKPPPSPKKKESDGDRISSMIERSRTWEQRRTTKIGRIIKERSKEEVKECTFSPKTQKSKTDRLAAAAESRVASEMAVMRSQSEQLAQMQTASLARHQSLRRGGGSQHSSVSRHSAAGGGGGGGGDSYAPNPTTTSSHPRSNTVPSDIIPTVTSSYSLRGGARNRPINQQQNENFLAPPTVPSLPTNSLHDHNQYSSRNASNLSQYLVVYDNDDDEAAAVASSSPTLEELSREEQTPMISGRSGGQYPGGPHPAPTSQYDNNSSRHNSRSSMHHTTSARGMAGSSGGGGGAAHRVVSTRSHPESNGSVDQLIGSWNELDVITDAVLNKLEASQS